MTMLPSAKIIQDSVSFAGDRLTTMEIVLHRFVLAEFNTHRVFSRNSASSRAIPVKRMLARAAETPAFPLEWPAEQKGMQGGAMLGPAELTEAQQMWDEARKVAIRAATHLTEIGLHKSVANRLLEPFLWHTVIVSSTEWDNFFMQRCSPLAQPEMRSVAELMRDAYDASTPRVVRIGSWHTPYIDDEDHELEDSQRQFVSAARCARVSYLTHDGIRDPREDLELFHKLISTRPGHWSPLEHVATPADGGRWRARGNFKGWAQLRHEFEPQGRRIEEVDEI